MSDITSTDLSWSARSITLDNGYPCLVIDLARPRITSLRFDPAGRGRYGANQLATALRASGAATTPDSGALTQYVDAGGILHSSSEARAARIADEHLVPTTGMLIGANPYSRLETVTIENIEYGTKRESWSLALHPAAPELTWSIQEHWLEPTEVTDCRTPVLWFSQRGDWGEPFHFQFLRKGMVHSDPYGAAAASLVPGASGASRAVFPDAGGSIVATTYARMPADVLVTGSAHLQRAAVLNWWSSFGQTRVDPHRSSTTASGDTESTFSVRMLPRETVGTRMQLSSPEDATRSARSLFSTHANCAMVANTHDGYLGNEPDGYHATMVSWMHARALLYATDAGADDDTRWSTLGLLRQQLRNIADSTDDAGAVHSGYAADTALDTNASFALSVVDHAITTGDAAFTGELLAPVRRALDHALRRAAATGGLLSATTGAPDEQSDAVIDYWDWLRRPGAVTYPNVLLFHALDRWADVEQWTGDASLARRYRRSADELRNLILETLWDDDRGCLAESALDGAQFTHLTTAVQYLAITSGLLDDARTRTVMATIDARLLELGDEWAAALAMPTNLYDARDLMPRFAPPADEVVEFGHTMNGGTLLSWAYFEIGALVAIGEVDAAWARARAVLDRFDSTALLEGGNYWDNRGRPDRARLEPFLSDVVLVAAALPRWFMGVRPELDRIDLDPALPAPGTWSLAFDHLGSPVEIVIHSWAAGQRRLTISGATLPVRLLERGRVLVGEWVDINGERRGTGEDGVLDVSARIS